MKIKNIVFFGFAAAILSSAAHADGVFQIASKAYVDGLVGTNGSITTDVANLKDAVGDSTDGLIKDVADLQDTVGDSTDGLVADVAALETAVGDTSGLETTFGENNDSVVEALGVLKTSVDGKVNISDKATSIRTVDGGASDDKWATEKAVADALAGVTGGSGTIAQQIATALGDIKDGNNNDITVEAALALKQNAADSNVASAAAGTYTAITAGNDVGANLVALDSHVKTAEGKITTLETAVGDSTSGLVADVEALQDAMGTDSVSDQIEDALGDLGTHTDPTSGDPVANTVEEALALKADASDVTALQNTMGTGTLTDFPSGVDTVIAALNALQSNKMNKPIENTCSAQSEHCVLHMDKDGVLSWIDITVPYAN